MSQPSASAPPASLRIPWWLWPHVLSLEAPVVALLWQAALADIHGVRLLPGVTEGLALVVWLIYLMDRTLDTVGTPEEFLDRRHRFYLRFRRSIVWGILPLGSALVGWLGLYVIPSGLMWHCIAVALLVAIYLAAYALPTARKGYMLAVLVAGLAGFLTVTRLPLVDAPKLAISGLILALMVLLCLRQFYQRFSGLFPKEVAAGILFAFGSVAAIRFLDLGGDIFANLLETILLALLFTSNLTAISAHEAESAGASPYSGSLSVHRLNRSTHRNTLLLSAVALFLGTTSLPARTATMASAVIFGVVLLQLLQGKFRHLSSDAFRVMADIAVAVPVLLLFWLG